ncbi:MAG: hypothetical protein Fur003_3860 [Candidatus Dojkabacteria bacterium]
MKLFYTAAYSGKKQYQKYYDLVLDAIKECDVDIISPELGGYKKVLSNVELRTLKSEREIHYEAIRKGIELSDAVIIEISQECFQLGHEATLAIMNKKPVFCLSIHEDFSKKIKNPYFYAAKYNESNVYELVDTFIDKVNIGKLNERFNLFLSKRQLEKVSNLAGKLNLTKSEYIRKLIDNS